MYVVDVYHIKKVKVRSYIARYPVLGPAQRALQFTSHFSGTFTYPPLSAVRYSIIQLSELWQRGMNEIAKGSKRQQEDLTRFAIQAKGPDGKWTRKPLAYRESNNVHLLITRPPEICVYLVFKHIHAASSYTICRQFVPFMYCPL